MRTNHTVKRGKRFSYVCSIPVDLQSHFPYPTLWKSLHTDDPHIDLDRLEARAKELFGL